MKFISLILCLVLQVQLTAVAEQNQTLVDKSQKAILVTGASSGIGRNIAETLAKEGHFVFAGARKAADISALSKIPNIQGIRLDVTVQSDIDNAVATIKKSGRGLYGLVNNAGVVILKPLIEASEQDMQFIMDVNLFGPYRVTKAFAPLLIESKGRVTSISSIAAYLSGALFGPYRMSKVAIEAYTDVLAAEMKKFDVQVSVIAPGNYNSKVFKNMHKRNASESLKDASSHYQQEYQALASFSEADRSQHKSPDEVTNAVKHALFAEQAKPRYMSTPNENESKYTLVALMRLLVQLNEGQQYRYDDETLTNLFQAQLSQAK